ncbi:hypothetical protein EYC84_000109 [Monilinia fructicola]|uniref:Uncharacterized protein n=1 Tax=Monilinia fructicola TaxID=38448 RepID=A0A5M9JQM1_MONFR|nr:hypothetical protein EYC84_000109 [Monilinia fructicola]
MDLIIPFFVCPFKNSVFSFDFCNRNRSVAGREELQYSKIERMPPSISSVSFSTILPPILPNTMNVCRSLHRIRYMLFNLSVGQLVNRPQISNKGIVGTCKLYTIPLLSKLTANYLNGSSLHLDNLVKLASKYPPGSAYWGKVTKLLWSQATEWVSQ